ncbi:MAG: prenyltransferase/squalene oxidase repeat-containing protein [Candidatus Wildermuthbacteria bacterium]|nr:prenyltransferase/squalene oxidase repeat-containing protein [Candidatus Wildermuthbacteria bacterium]
MKNKFSFRAIAKGEKRFYLFDLFRFLGSLLTTFILFVALPAASALADVPIHLEIYTATTTLFNGDISVSGCTTPSNATSTVNGFCAFSVAGISVDAASSSYGVFINSIGGVAGDSDNFWLWFLNGDIAATGIDSYQPLSGDHVLWTIGREPLKISASPTSPVVGATTTVRVLGFDTNAFDFVPLAGAAISGVSVSTTNANGNTDILATSTNPFTISASANGFLPSQSITITPRAPQASLAIRDGSALVGPFTMTLPAANASPVLIAPTATTTTYAVPARSVLALLISADAATSSFDITDLQYFSSFSSFLVNCISVPASAAPDCFNWTYAVNGLFPSFGMDGYILQDGDTAYIFFGSQLQVSTDKASALTGESFTVTAQKYDPASGLYVPAIGEIAGAVQFDSYFTATEFATSTVDASGHATLSVGTQGAYLVGVASSGYFPNTSVTVSAPRPVIFVPQSIASSGGESNLISHHNIDTDKALQFLSARQKANGSFGASLYTDWAAIALAVGPDSLNKDKITAYLKSAPNDSVSVTDYERHAMALMSLGINPYSGADTNYIQKIVDSFDGAQIGDSSIVNDDIFAIFPLIKSGYSEVDAIIQKVIAFILQKQRPDGSWEGGVDMTAAAVQSLALVPQVPGVYQAKANARDYLSRSQQSGGGFNSSSFSTSWALQAIAALSESPLSWQKNNNTPGDYLYSFQQSDGGIEPLTSDENTRVWATAYAVPAALGKPWAAILSSFPRPTVSIVEVAPMPAEATTGIPVALPIEEATSTATTSVFPVATTTQDGKSAEPVANIPSTTSVSLESLPKNSEPASPSLGGPAPPVSQQASAIAAVGTNGVIEAIKHTGSLIANAVSLFINMFLSAWRRW